MYAYAISGAEGTLLAFGMCALYALGENIKMVSGGLHYYQESDNPNTQISIVIANVSGDDAIAYTGR